MHHFRVVKSVLASEEAESDEIQWIQPSNDNREDSDNDDTGKKENQKQLRRQSSFETSIKTGATRIMNPKNKKRMETCLVENDNFNSNSILATETNDIDEQNWIQPGTTREDDDTNETPHNSLLHDFKESISETLHHLHLSHHTKSEGAIKDKHGLLETAMETMLMEQANILGAQSVPSMPRVPSSDHIGAIKFEEKRNSSIESFKKLLVAPFRRRSNDSNDLKPPKKEMKKEKFSLFDSAMKTMLNETAHIIEGVGLDVHPKSIDKDDGVIEMKSSQAMSSPSKIYEPKMNINSFEPKLHDVKQDVESQNTPLSYSKFCDNLTLSHVLTNDEPTYPSAGNNNQSSSEVPIFVLTKCTSKQTTKKSIDIDPNTHIDIKTLSPSSHDRVLVDNMFKNSPKMMKNSVHNTNPNNINLSKTLIHSHSGDLINQTNIAKLLAHDPNSKNRSQDENGIPVNASGGKHTRAESYGMKTQTSPTKVPTSSSSYNTSTCVPATANLSASKGKDGKDPKETICRRSSDSDLSVTPKGNTLF